MDDKSPATERAGAAPTAPAVVITGPTEGIGRALAEEFARAGQTLLLVARDRAALERTAANLKQSYGVEVRVTAQDLSTEEGCAGVEEALSRYHLHADCLVNNAGVMSSGFFQDEDPETVARLINLDIRAVADLTRRFLPGMLARRRGGVLNVASMMGFMPVPYQVVYAAAKAFVLSFTKALAYETMGTGVTVSAVAPGVVATRLHAKAGSQNSYYTRFFPTMTPEQVARAAYRGFHRGRTLIVPGIFNQLAVSAMGFMPDFLLVPTMGLFFRVRDEEGNPQGPGAGPHSGGMHKRPTERRASPVGALLRSPVNGRWWSRGGSNP
jgi:short-subunit dehydrogenase